MCFCRCAGIDPETLRRCPSSEQSMHQRCLCRIIHHHQGSIAVEIINTLEHSLLGTMDGGKVLLEPGTSKRTISFYSFKTAMWLDAMLYTSECKTEYVDLGGASANSYRIDTSLNTEYLLLSYNLLSVRRFIESKTSLSVDSLIESFPWWCSP